jgi:putative membrane protein
MQRFIITWIISALALALTAQLVPGIHLAGWTTAAIAALIFGLINATVRPILFLFTLPLNILSLGLFSLVINAFCLMLVAYFSPTGFVIEGFIPALIGSIVLAIASSGLHSLFGILGLEPES